MTEVEAPEGAGGLIGNPCGYRTSRRQRSWDSPLGPPLHETDRHLKHSSAAADRGFVEPKSKAQALVVLAVLLSVVGLFLLFGPFHFRPDPSASDEYNESLETWLIGSRWLVGIALLFVARWAWRKGRRTLNPTWVPPKSFQSFRRRSPKSAAPATAPSQDQTPPIPPPP